MEQELQIKRKKRKMLINMDEEPQPMTVDLIKLKLISIFKSHIGEASAIDNYELFEKVFREKPEFLNPYKVAYFWEVVMKAAKALRRTDKVFIIIKKQKMYVLQTREEADWYKNMLDNNIRRMENAQTRADEWVTQEKWRNI